MSSRALRKLQKQREQEAQLAALRASEEVDDSDDERLQSQPSKTLNAFDLLNDTGQIRDELSSDSGDNIPAGAVTPPPEAAIPTISSDVGRKKKKNKKKSTRPARKIPTEPSKGAELDEIDRALKELSTSHPWESWQAGQEQLPDEHIRFAQATSTLLCIDPRSLNATNEMRRLFGNVVLESFEQAEQGGTNRRRDRDQRMLDLGRALTGRFSPASKGKSLAGVTLRKNILMHGKDEWPRTPNGGLGMELVEKQQAGSSKYKIVHNTAYQDVQNQFNLCVESMDPQRLIHLLQYNRKC